MTEETKLEIESNGKEVTVNENEGKEIESAIIGQVEYYFGDVNLPRDKFLSEQVKLDDGWIPLDVLITFNRLGKITKDTDKIAAALHKSTSGLLEISDDNKKVRRSPEIPLPEMNEERRKELLGRTIYAKGFPKDVTLDELLKYFRQFKEVENIVMRKYLDRHTKQRLFKGSIFATFKSKEQAANFIEIKDIKYNDSDLIILWQENYLQQKQDEYANRKEKKEKKTKDKEAKEEKEEFKLPMGTILYFNQENKNMKREDIKEALETLGEEIAFIEFKVGDKEGWVRFLKENSAKQVAEKIKDGKLKIGDSEVEFKLLEGDDEKQYLDKTVEEMSKRRRNTKNFKQQNKGKHFKGKQGRKRKQDNDNDSGSTPAKVNAI